VNTIELTEHGVDTGSTLYFDATTGALVAVANVSNLNWSCWGTIPRGGCDELGRSSRCSECSTVAFVTTPRRPLTRETTQTQAATDGLEVRHRPITC
jgi:hypothetical protein